MQRSNVAPRPFRSEMLRNNPARIHVEALWQPEVVNVYLPLLDFCTNPETTEAACACLQNLTACDWLVSSAGFKVNLCEFKWIMVNRGE